MKDTLIRFAKILAMFLFSFFSVISAAGSMNYGHASHQGLYTISGIVALLCAAYAVYRASKEVR